jgi:hypothetical protein
VWLWLSRDGVRADGHLQHGRVLAWAQFRHLYDLTVRQFESVMMDTRLMHIHLPKSSDLVLEPFETEAIAKSNWSSG